MRGGAMKIYMMHRRLWNNFILLLVSMTMPLQPMHAQQSQKDSCISGGAKFPLPKSLRPKIKDGVILTGEARSDATGVELNIPISRCVTSRHPDERFPSSGPWQTYLEKAIADGLVTKTTKFTLFIFIERLPNSANGTVELSDLEFWGDHHLSQNSVSSIALNGLKTSMWGALLNTASSADKGNAEKWNILSFTEESRYVLFGSPNYSYDNHVDELFRANHDNQSIAPMPGNNRIRLSTFGKALAGSTQTGMKYRIHLYGMGEFGAMAPIIFVHGTNANSSTWNDPTKSADSTSTLMDASGIARTLDNSPTVNLTGAPENDLRGRYAGPWFYKIDLGPAGLYGEDAQIRQGLDRYSEEQPDWGDSGGNAGNKYSAEQLRVLIPLVLEMYGMNGKSGIDTSKNWIDAKCHIIAHSKGGSDCRWLVTKTLHDEGPAAPKRFTVLGFFSLGTPFRGTPNSDVGYICRQIAVGVDYFVQAGQGVNPIIKKNIQDSASTIFLLLAGDPSKIPKGKALMDQRYHLDSGNFGWESRNIAFNSWDMFIQNRGQYYSVTGDADLDGDKAIGAEEWKVLAPTGVFLNKLMPESMAATYRMLATLDGNLELEKIVKSGSYGHSTATRIVIKTGTSTNWMPNDLVTPYLSALPYELEGTIFDRRVTFRHAFLDKFKIKREQRGGNLPDVDAGNHSMLKNPAVIDGAISIIKQQYPPKY